MKILITGSEGFIGRQMAADLTNGHELVLFDRRERADHNSPGHFVLGDLMDIEACKRAVHGVEAIAHLGAIGHARVPECYLRNTVGTWNLLSAAAAAGVKRIAFSSTINVYGQGGYKVGSKPYNPPSLPIDENTPPRPEDPYGLSKLANEHAMRGFSDAYGISAYCFRLAGVWTAKMTTEYRPHPIHGHWVPRPTHIIDPWNYVDIRDVVGAFRRFLEMPNPPEFGVSYLVADETTRDEPTMDLLARYIPQWVPLAGDRLPGHTPWFSNRRVKQDLAWAPKHSWRNGKQVASCGSDSTPQESNY